MHLVVLGNSCEWAIIVRVKTIHAAPDEGTALRLPEHWLQFSYDSLECRGGTYTSESTVGKDEKWTRLAAAI